MFTPRKILGILAGAAILIVLTVAIIATFAAGLLIFEFPL